MDKKKKIDGKLSSMIERPGDSLHFHDPSKPGYNAICVLKNGDLLTVFNDKSKKTILWSGTISLKYNYELDMDIQKNVPVKVWKKMFEDEKPATLSRR